MTPAALICRSRSCFSYGGRTHCVNSFHIWSLLQAVDLELHAENPCSQSLSAASGVPWADVVPVMHAGIAPTLGHDRREGDTRRDLLALNLLATFDRHAPNKLAVRNLVSSTL